MTGKMTFTVFEEHPLTKTKITLGVYPSLDEAKASLQDKGIEPHAWTYEYPVWWAGLVTDVDSPIVQYFSILKSNPMKISKERLLRKI